MSKDHFTGMCRKGFKPTTSCLTQPLLVTADQFSSSKVHDEARPILLYQVLLFQLLHSGLTEQCPNKAPNTKLVHKILKKYYDSLCFPQSSKVEDGKKQFQKLNKENHQLSLYVP